MLRRIAGIAAREATQAGQLLEAWSARDWLAVEESSLERFLASFPGMHSWTAQILLLQEVRDDMIPLTYAPCHIRLLSSVVTGDSERAGADGALGDC